MAGNDRLGARFRHRPRGHRVIDNFDLGPEIGHDRDRNDGDQKQQKRIFSRSGGAGGATEHPENIFPHNLTPCSAGGSGATQQRSRREMYKRACFLLWHNKIQDIRMAPHDNRWRRLKHIFWRMNARTGIISRCSVNPGCDRAGCLSHRHRRSCLPGRSFSL